MSRTEPSESQVLDLVDRIYAAASDLDRWPPLLEEISDMLGGPAVTVAAGNPDPLGPQPVHVGVGFDADLGQEYREHPERWAPHNPYVPLGVTHPNRLVDTRLYLSDSEVMRTHFYEAWMRPQGLRPGSVRSFWEASAEGPAGASAYYPTERCPEFSGPQLRRIERIDRHLVRSARTLAMLEITRAERAAFLEALDDLERGVLLLDATGRLLAANRAGDELLGKADGLTVRDGELVAALPPVTSRLRECIARAVRHQAVVPAIVVPRPSGARGYQVVVSPLHRRVSGLRGACSAAVVFVTDPERGPQPVEQVLAALYGLTPAEARVASAVGSGCSLREYAEHAERSLETVRSLLQRVFAKTGTRRQAELAALVSSGPASLRTRVPGD